MPLALCTVAAWQASRLWPLGPQEGLRVTSSLLLPRGVPTEGGPPAARLTSRCMLFTWVGLMDKASSYHRRASSMFPRSSATWPRMYRTLWDMGKRLAASWVQAVASAGFPMPM